MLYLLASRCEELGEYGFFDVCMNHIEEYESSDYLSSECLPLLLIDYRIPEKTFTFCLDKAIRNQRLSPWSQRIHDNQSRLLVTYISSRNIKACSDLIDTIKLVDYKIASMIDLARDLVQNNPEESEKWLMKAFNYSIENGCNKTDNYGR